MAGERTRRARRPRAPIAACLALHGALAAVAPAFSAEPASITVEAGGSGSFGRDATLVLRAKGDALRVDMPGGGGRGGGGRLLVDASDGSAWLVAPGGEVALPVARTGFEALRVDPARPCVRMQARCEPAAGDVVAGVPVDGWRYRHAGGRGPDGTSSGTLWVDRESGTVLAYRGEVAGRADRREMRARTVSRLPIDDAAFLPPSDPARGSR